MQDTGVDSYPSMPVEFGDVKATVFGGPFEEYVPGQRRLVSVKMAQELDLPHDISIPTRDFSTPNLMDLHLGLREALKAILAGNDLYVGCKGGIGRTGLFMACLAKVMIDYDTQDETGRLLLAKYNRDPVKYVRGTYYHKAVETDEQKAFIGRFDTSEHVNFLLDELEPLPKVEVREVVKEVVKEVYVFNPFKAFLQFWGLDKRG
jgi:hypothetical protein